MLQTHFITLTGPIMGHGLPMSYMESQCIAADRSGSQQPMYLRNALRCFSLCMFAAMEGCCAEPAKVQATPSRAERHQEAPMCDVWECWY